MDMMKADKSLGGEREISASLDGAAELHALPVQAHASSFLTSWAFHILSEPSVRLPVTAALVALKQSRCCKV